MTTMPVPQRETVNEPFQWGSGGRRLTPDQIERERQIAASLIGVDYSPIASPWQGLARVAGNGLGVLHNAKADKAASVNLAENNSVLSALLDPQGSGSMSPAGEVPAVGGTPSGNSAITAALTNPYIDGATKNLAMQQYTQANKRAQPLEINGKLVDPVTLKVLGDYSTPQQGPEIVQLAQIENDPTRPQYERDAARDRRIALNDPFASIPLPGGQTYIGPRSGISGMTGGGAPNQITPQPPSTLPPDFNFGSGDAPVGQSKKIGGPMPQASGNFR